MRLNEKLDIIRIVKTPDGMGGFSTGDDVIGTIYGYIVPIISEVVEKEYGIRSNKASKIITKDKIVDIENHLEVDGVKYNILREVPSQRFNIYLVELWEK